MTNQELLAMYSVILDSDKLDSMEITKKEGLADIINRYLQTNDLDIIAKVMIANVSLEAGLFYIKALMNNYIMSDKAMMKILTNRIEGLTELTDGDLSIRNQKLILAKVLLLSRIRVISLISEKLLKINKVIPESKMLHPTDEGIGILAFAYENKEFYMPNGQSKGRTISPYMIFQLSDNRYAIITSERSLIDLRIEDETLYIKEQEMFIDKVITQLVYNYIDTAMTKENINKELGRLCDFRVNYDKIISLVALYCGVDETDITIEYSTINETEARRINYQYLEDCGIVRIDNGISIGVHVLKNTIKVDVSSRLVI